MAYLTGRVERGDGEAAASCCSRMFGERLMSEFRELKDICDPRDQMNPGNVYPHDGGSFVHAANRCVGVVR